MTEQYVQMEQRDFAMHVIRPSPRGQQWRLYIQHRIRMLRSGMATYARPKYARLSLDKYIQTNRAMDTIAKKITNNEPSIIYIGAAQMAPNSPIGIKKYKRCPSVRKLGVSVKKLGHSKIKYTPEHNSSLTCANCFRRFPIETRNHRFKVCRQCRGVPKGNPNVPDSDKNANLPPKIVTQLSKRALQVMRDDVLTDAVLFNQPVNRPLVPKVKVYQKNWPRIDEMAQDNQKLPTIVWHRDIVAAKCILYKGMCEYHVSHCLP